MSQTATGAKLELTIGLVLVAYASNCSYSFTTSVEAIQGIDNLVVDEHAETGITVNFTASMFRVAHTAAVENGWQPKLEVLLQQPELVATVKDKISGATLLQLTGLKLVGRTGSVDARGVFVETLNFVAKRFYDESL